MPLVELIYRYYGVKLSVTLCQGTTIAETKESRNAVISLRTIMTHIIRTDVTEKSYLYVTLSTSSVILLVLSRD